MTYGSGVEYLILLLITQTSDPVHLNIDFEQRSTSGNIDPSLVYLRQNLNGEIPPLL